jgi:hypothetical protein
VRLEYKRLGFARGRVETPWRATRMPLYAERCLHAPEMSILKAVMPKGSPRWIALTTANVAAVLVGIFALIAERSLFGYLILIVGALGFATIWTLQRDATQQALRAIAWAIIWFVTGGGGPWNRRR